MTLGSTVLDAASNLLYQLSAPNIVGNGVNDLTEINGNLELNGKLSVGTNGDMNTGVYRLFDYTGTLVNDGLTIGWLPNGVVATLDFSIAHQVNLDVTAVPEPATFALACLSLPALYARIRFRNS